MSVLLEFATLKIIKNETDIDKHLLATNNVTRLFEGIPRTVLTA
jgi:hypothetical protein